jgi:hypothetical protein
MIKKGKIVIIFSNFHIQKSTFTVAVKRIKEKTIEKLAFIDFGVP